MEGPANDPQTESIQAAFTFTMRMVALLFSIMVVVGWTTDFMPDTLEVRASFAMLAVMIGMRLGLPEQIDE